MAPAPLDEIRGAVIRPRAGEAERMVDEVNDLPLLVTENVAFVPVLLADQRVEERRRRDLVRHGVVEAPLADVAPTEDARSPDHGGTCLRMVRELHHRGYDELAPR